MIIVQNVSRMNFDSIPVDTFWNTGEGREMKMHRIHAYPAKFPAFITTKALAYANENSLTPKRIGDVFCGCGTVAYEARRNNIDFWGCDINPVATLIARVKSNKYQKTKLKSYFEAILNAFNRAKRRSDICEKANKRLVYWHSKKRLEDLHVLREAIEQVVPSRSSYLLFFLCAFSNILKPTSRWLTKSIKPQIDPHKRPARVLDAFKEQCSFMMSANDANDIIGSSISDITTGNFLDNSLQCPKVDMIITSPPYVTSYEYADLHQLSSLWLGYAHDYRDLRAGSIGSLQHVYNFDKELKRLNRTGASVVFRLIDRDKSQARSVTKYFLDMQQVAKKCHGMLSTGGMALFVIGDTEYKGVRIENARHLSESLLESGFEKVLITKRKISGKILTPYRNAYGRFTTDKGSRKIYGEEFIVIGRKK